MKQPTLEEVREHFKDAKVVISNYYTQFIIDTSTIHLGSSGCYYAKDLNNESRNVWDKFSNCYAEIVEYKTKATQINIDIPQGYEIDKDNSTFECIKFKKIEKQLPNSWSDFIMNNNGASFNFCDDFMDTPQKYKALRKLELLRDCYNDGWVADWDNSNKCKYVIHFYTNKITTNNGISYSKFLNFKTAELRDLFLKNFRDIIEIAKPLL